METKIKKGRKKVFKAYDQKQYVRVPLSIEEFIEPGHLVRIIDGMVEGLNMEDLEAYYPGGGSSAYHPKMMIKVWLYGYCKQLYTSRPLARALREQLPMMWLAGGQTPNFKTLSEFRGNRMQGIMDLLFKEVLCLLVKEEYIDLGDLYIDGSKWEANANRHKVVWAKNTERYKAAVLSRIEDLLEQVHRLQGEEDLRYGSKDLPEVGSQKEVQLVLTSAQVCENLERINDLIAQNASDSNKEKCLKKVSKALRKEGEKLSKYEQQEVILAHRNSFSHTDKDATCLRMKDDRLLPGYNLQHTTSNQFIVNYTVEQCASDSTTLIAHLDKMEARFEELPKVKELNVCADAGYGSEENYVAMQKRHINAYVKYPLFFQEQSGELLKAKFRRENFPYDPQQDEFTCPNGRKLTYRWTQIETSTTGYERRVRSYECQSCEGCVFAPECKKNPEKNRTVQFSPLFEAYKDKARDLLLSDKGKQMRAQRSIEVETAFADLKFNMQHRRFVLRKRKKVYVEFGFLAISHNLRKIYCEKSGIWEDYYVQRANKRA